MTTITGTTTTLPLLAALPDDWPEEVKQMFNRALVCEYASLTRAGRPITWPVTPYLGQGGTLDVSTGLTYPDKAERARRDPRVSLLFSDPVGTVLERTPVVLVEGHAAVRDLDLQANTDRYVRASIAKFPATFAGLPWFFVRRLGWYFARIWVEVTPLRMAWWPDGDLTRPPLTWTAGSDTPRPESDPAPKGQRLPSRSVPPADWRPFAERASHLGTPVVTVVDEQSGWPVPIRAVAVRRTDEGFVLDLPAGLTAAAGPVCLTFHQHGPQMEWQENVVMVGTGRPTAAGLEVHVERALNDWSLNGSRRQARRRFMAVGKELRRRVSAEATRRGQPVPVVNRPVT